jgi:hypothetical protein
MIGLKPPREASARMSRLSGGANAMRQLVHVSKSGGFGTSHETLTLAPAAIATSTATISR